MTKDELMQLADDYAYATINVQDPEARRGAARQALSDAIDAAIKEAVAAERERCAKVCDEAVSELIATESNKDVIEIAVGLREAIRKETWQ